MNTAREEFSNIPDGPNGERPAQEARIFALFDTWAAALADRMQFPPYNGMEDPESENGNGKRAVKPAEVLARRDSMFLTTG
jgi:hypothetical protein